MPVIPFDCDHNYRLITDETDNECNTRGMVCYTIS
jgi:hypothetical protein